MFKRLFSWKFEDIFTRVLITLGIGLTLALLRFHLVELNEGEFLQHIDIVVTGFLTILTMFLTVVSLVRSKARLKEKTDELVALKADLEHKISERTLMLQDAINELEVLASVDSLTQVSNRRHIKNILRDEASRAKRAGTNFSVIMLDIDHFKMVNDTYGHAVGDDVLRAVAKTCEVTVRQVDRVGRIGGEEFLVVLPEASHPDALQVAERIRREVFNLTFPQKDLTVTISLGVSTCDNECTVTELLEQADQALYDAKDSGRNMVCSHKKR